MAVAAVPCAAATGSPTSDRSLGSDTRRSERHGPSGALPLAGRNRPRAARRRPTAPQSRAAVTAAIPRGGLRPQALTASAAHTAAIPRGGLRPQALTASAAHHLLRSAGVGAPRPADPHAAVAVTAPHNSDAPRTTAIAATTNFTAAPAGTGTTSLAPAGLWTCCRAPRVQLANAGPSSARTQGAAFGGAKGKPEDAAMRSVSAAARCAWGARQQVLDRPAPARVGSRALSQSGRPGHPRRAPLHKGDM